MRALAETLADQHVWLRVAMPEWSQPLDTSYALVNGGRWNTPGARHALYLCADETTARVQVDKWASERFVIPRDLRGDQFVAVPVQLPIEQRVADVHTDEGVQAVGLPASYPRQDAQAETIVAWEACQLIGDHVAELGLRGVHARSAAPTATVRELELAWFPPPGAQPHVAGGTRQYAQWR